ncbi:putative homeodomain-interacting protein kinase 2-like [Scophthalmus maximus]|uniref:Putative homeodomain-interacting protein kinase 2-like n=1 Tax=Scophthalmus maximus TaxID=52904 RepID=A0A2U9BYZ7_SCOMX|nr:putative homeodomain-interacting protein kinase 2-like [Scophthalmus maximus]
MKKVEVSETMLVKTMDVLQGTSREEVSLPDMSREKHSYTDKPNQDNAPGPSTATDKAPPTEEESGTAATFTEDITNTNPLPAVCEPGDDRPPADIPTDEAAASISPYCSVLQSETTSYIMTGEIGLDYNRYFVKCVELTTGKEVAVKIPYYEEFIEETFQNELAMLEKIRALDPDRHNIVTFIEKCQYDELPCLVFEVMDISLLDLLKERERRALSVNEIRPVTQQLLVALEALKNIGIIHMDLNPDNIILVNHKDQPFKIKLSDFGLARPVSQVSRDDVTRTLWYRPPEGVLGLCLSEAADMWGVGCVMAFMYFGMHLFPNDCPEEWIDSLVYLLGFSDQKQISAGKNSWMYFFMDEWRRRKITIDEKRFGVSLPDYPISFDPFLKLEERVKTFQIKKDDLEYEDRMEFLDLLKCCLHVSAEQRICPREALCHRFITMAHLADEKETNSYTNKALEFMKVCSSYYQDKSKESSYLMQLATADATIETVVETGTRNSKPKELCLNFDEDSAPTRLARLSSISCLSEEVPLPDNAPRPSAATDTAPPTEEESGTAATFTENITNTNRLPAVCEPGDDRPPADIPTDEAAASISSNHRVLQSETTSYKITGFIGGGGCANVAKCVDLNTGKEVAIKIHNKKCDEEIIQNELAMLGKIRALDPDRHNIVTFIEKCQYGELPCLVFEMLDTSLSDLIEERECRALSLNEIHPVTQQLLVALEALKNIGIIHMDLNPDNIMLVNHKDQSFKIKLIDFGLARPVSQEEVSLPDMSREKHSYTDKPNQDNAPGPSAATLKAPPTEEESGTAATFTQNISSTNRLPAVCEPGDDRPPADIPTDEAAASISSNHRVLQSKTTSYKIAGFIGGGGCADVAKCVDLNTGKEVAIKISRDNENKEIIQSELAMLEKIRALDPDQHNIVKFIEHFQFGELPCLVFEMLDTSLSDLIEQRQCRALSLNEIRPVTQQLLVALEALKNIGIIHMDLNPDNIMLVNHKDQPFKIKLSDFGLACPEGEVMSGAATGTLPYMPPEGVLGLWLSEALDMWGVGCVMAFMYSSRHLFPYKCPEDWMDAIVHLFDLPEYNHVRANRHRWKYFFLDKKAEWRRRKPMPYKQRFGVSSTISENFFYSFLNLEDAVQTVPKSRELLLLSLMKLQPPSFKPRSCSRRQTC